MRIGERSMFQLGYGKYGKMIEATINSDTSGVAVDIACDKLLTKELLFNQRLPVARGGKVQNSLDLLLKAESIGYPVVLKPRYGNQGKGVFVNIKNEKELLNAYNLLIKNYSDLMIERYIKGRDFRVCIVDGEVIAVAERIPPYIIGDGKSTVRRLVQLLNKDERRGKGHEKPLTKVKIDEALMEHIRKYGYDINSIIPKNEKLTLRENANLSTGGTAVDYTGTICEENIDICKRAAKAIGLNICGIDLCCMDISIPVEKDGAIIEINAAPGIRMHHYPFEGASRNVAGAIVDMMFKDIPSSIPLIAVTGTNGKTTTTRLIGHVLELCGHNVGMTTTGGIYINNKCIDNGDTTGYSSAMTILLNREVDAAVLETARGGIIRQGLAYDAADVAVITNITEDHLGIDGIDTLEQLANVKSLVGEAVKPNGYVVLNADDYMSTTIIERMKSSIIMFSMDKNNKFVRDNISNGGLGVYNDEGIIYVEDREKKIPIVKVEDILITLQGNLAYNVENAMAACAGLIGLGVDYKVIKQGLISFRGDVEHNPGRFNMFNVNGATVILDYGHNMEGYKAVLKGALNLKQNRLIGVIGVPGDRLNSDIIEVGSISARYFDYIYIKEDKDKRGRRENEVAELLKQGVLSAQFDNEKVEIILEEREALRTAIDNAKLGDIIITFFEKYEPLLDLVKNYENEKSKTKENIIMA
jgi:cyanophycin synthetase